MLLGSNCLYVAAVYTFCRHGFSSLMKYLLTKKKKPLRMQFPELFRLARLPDASVADHLSFLGSTC